MKTAKLKSPDKVYLILVKGSTWHSPLFRDEVFETRKAADRRCAELRKQCPGIKFQVEPFAHVAKGE